MKTIALILMFLMVFTAAVSAADMEMQTVKSSLLDKVGYDAETKTLVIHMLNSLDVYTYKDVPQSIYDGLIDADSKGTYFVDKIKGKFDRKK